MSVFRIVLGVLIVIGMSEIRIHAQATPSRVQDRQFIFSVSALPSEVRHGSVNVDSGFGTGAFEVTDSDRPEHRVGIQAALGRRVTFLGRIGLSSDDRDLRTSQQGELLLGVLESAKTQASVALGMGMRHESLGTNVMLGRIVAGRSFSAWRLDGNALFEKPFAIGRDAVDLITSLGLSRRLSPSFSAGVEVVGEDLEGFWEADEAEGGARLLIGPSIRIAPPAKRWQIGAAGGPMLRGSRSDRSSGALRGLPAATSGTSFAVRVSMSYGFCPPAISLAAVDSATKSSCAVRSPGTWVFHRST